MCRRIVTFSTKTTKSTRNSTQRKIKCTVSRAHKSSSAPLSQCGRFLLQYTHVLFLVNSVDFSSRAMHTSNLVLVRYKIVLSVKWHNWLVHKHPNGRKRDNRLSYSQQHKAQYQCKREKRVTNTLPKCGKIARNERKKQTKKENIEYGGLLYLDSDVTRFRVCCTVRVLYCVCRVRAAP